jgi:hypothetical protein
MHLQKLSKTVETGKTAIMMVNVMGFSIKVLELSYKQYSFIQGGDGGMGMPCVL